jgi:hypothetical protein
MSQQSQKPPGPGQHIERGTIFPTFKVNVPMPKGTAPSRPVPVAPNQPTAPKR